MTPEPTKLIAALHNILSQLEQSAVPGRDEESFAELKRILNLRIRDLETCAPLPSSAARAVEAASDAD